MLIEGLVLESQILSELLGYNFTLEIWKKRGSKERPRNESFQRKLEQKKKDHNESHNLLVFLVESILL